MSVSPFAPAAPTGAGQNPTESPDMLCGRRRHPRRAAARGFTLIELLLVLIILAVLAAVVVPKFASRSEQARDAAARTDISAIETALDAFELDTGRFPSSQDGLSELVTQPGNVKTWRGPYIKRGVPNDPWGHPYVYKYPGTHNQNGYDLSSMGPDGREGGTDDIDNWSPAK
jgi:general secretion pathway protein G